MTESLLKFPTEIVVKAMGRADASTDFETLVSAIVSPHLEGAEATVTSTSSSKAKYLSVRVRFIAQNRAQLEAIYRDLHANERVLYTL